MNTPAQGIPTLQCAGVVRFIDTYLDGEFGEQDRVEFEAHLASCASCRAKVKEQVTWKNAIRTAAAGIKASEQASAALRNRIQRSLASAARDADRNAGEGRLRWRRFVMRALPVAAVAGLVGTLTVSRLHWSPIALDVVAKHKRNLPLEVSGPADKLKSWYSDKLEFPVRPPRLEGASLRGGRLANVGQQQAAYLLYDASGNKVSVFIFDAGDMQFETSRRMMVNDREVFVDEDRGYNVAMFRQKGVGYAIASDIPEAQMLQFVSAIGR